MVGRAMMDIEKRGGRFEPPHTEKGLAVLVGVAPVVTMRDYQTEVIAYTKGHGKLFCNLEGYEPCHNTEEIVNQMGYDSETDLMNPTGSVFCAHGSGYLFNWDTVYDHMHLPLRETGRAAQETSAEVSKTHQIGRAHV